MIRRLVVLFLLGSLPAAARESEIVDWLIAKPDGSEEGNIVGNFMDSYHPPQSSCADRAG